VCPEFTVLNICFLSFRIFEQLALALKNRVVLKFINVLEYFLSFRSFEQLTLAVKTEFALVAIGKARAAFAQSFAPWQQATIEFTRRDHSIIACSLRVYILLLFAHIPLVVNHTFNATPPKRLQHPEIF